MFKLDHSDTGGVDAHAADLAAVAAPGPFGPGSEGRGTGQILKSAADQTW